MPASRIVEVARHLDVGASASAFDLSATGRESVEHLERWGIGERGLRHRLVAPLEACFVEEVAANGSGLRNAEDILGRVARVSARRQIEIANAKVAAARAVALIAGAERMRLGQGVIDASREVGTIRRPSYACSDVAFGQRGVDRLRVVSVDAIARERKPGAVFLDRSTQRQRAVLLLFRRSARGERVAGVERFVPEREVDRAA